MPAARLRDRNSVLNSFFMLGFRTVAWDRIAGARRGGGYCFVKRITAVSTPASDRRWRAEFMSSNLENGPTRTR